MCYNPANDVCSFSGETIVRFVLIGHITRDIVPAGSVLGGSVSYGGITARRLGADVAILTRARPEDTQDRALAGIEIINLPSAHTTTFHNIYRQGERRQHLREVAAPILAADVPEALKDADIVLLAPLAQEVDPEIATGVSGLLGATPQGWLREWDDKGQVFSIPWYSAGRVLPHLDAVILSETELAADPTLMATLPEAVPVVVITNGAEGSTLYWRGTSHLIPARSTQEVDPTGAGDVFAAAFLIRLHESGDALQAAHFANVAASLSVENQGVLGIPDRAQIETHLRSAQRLP